MTKEALKLALEALIEDRAWLESDAPKEVWDKNNEAITAIRQALANDALEKKAENARELGLNYEPDIKYPSYCCQKCGEFIGWLGQVMPFHKCKGNA